MNDSTVKSPDMVGYEFTKTLEVARAHLEEYVGGPSGRETLARCVELLHHFCDVLKIAEIYGAALLAEEIKKVLTDVELRRSMSLNGKALVDGKGLDRIIKHIPRDVLETRV